MAGDSWTGDISLDDVDFYEGTCRGSLMCDFENGLCTFDQVTNDQFDWIRKKGSTRSQGTGPLTDHTFGTGEGMSCHVSAIMPPVTAIKPWSHHKNSIQNNNQCERESNL